MVKCGVYFYFLINVMGLGLPTFHYIWLWGYSIIEMIFPFALAKLCPHCRPHCGLLYISTLQLGRYV